MSLTGLRRKYQTEFKLLPNQVEHFEKLLKILTVTEEQRLLENYNWPRGKIPGVDISCQGSGKTYIAGNVGLYLLKREMVKAIIVIGPANVEMSWQKMAKKLNIRINFISYAKFRSNRFKFLIEGKIGNSKVYYPSLKLKLMLYGADKIDGKNANIYDPDLKFEGVYNADNKIKENLKGPGYLFIVDEFQAIKNLGTRQTSLLNGLIDAYSDYDSDNGFHNSYLLNLSATPIDKVEQSFPFFKALGIANQNPLLSGKNSGLQQIISFCYNIDPKTTLDKIKLYAYNIIDYSVYKGDLIISTGKGINQERLNLIYLLLHSLLVSIIKPRYISSVPGLSISRKKIKFDAKNLFAKTDKEGTKLIRQGVAILQSVAAYYDKTGRMKFDTSLVNGLMKIEAGKLNTLIRLATKELESGKNNKVIIAVFFNKSVETLLAKLSKYRPLEYTGRSSVRKKRDNNLKMFQQADNKHRLLIINPMAAAVGLDMDDQDGRFPRTMFIAPSSYSIIILYQTIGRVYRSQTMSDVKIRMVYSQNEPGENKLLDKLASKSTVVKSLGCDAIKTPGEFAHLLELNKEVPQTYQQIVNRAIRMDKDTLATRDQIIIADYENINQTKIDRSLVYDTEFVTSEIKKGTAYLRRIDANELRKFAKALNIKKYTGITRDDLIIKLKREVSKLDVGVDVDLLLLPRHQLKLIFGGNETQNIIKTYKGKMLKKLAIKLNVNVLGKDLATIVNKVKAVLKV